MEFTLKTVFAISYKIVQPKYCVCVSLFRGGGGGGGQKTGKYATCIEIHIVVAKPLFAIWSAIKYDHSKQIAANV